MAGNFVESQRGYNKYLINTTGNQDEIEGIHAG